MKNTLLKSTIYLAMALLSASLFLQNCKKDLESTTDSSSPACQEFSDGLKQLSSIQQPAPQAKVNVGAPVTEQSGDYICQLQTVKWAPEYNELYLLDPKNEVIYPAALIDANSVSTGAYTPIANVERAPVTISISVLTNDGEKSSIDIPDPRLSEVRNHVNTLLYRVAPGSTRADLNFESYEIRAREEVDLAVRASFKGWGAKIASSFNFETEEKKTRLIFQFFQKYYTIDMDIPKTSCAFFKNGQLPDLGTFDGTSPVYVSSVTYGRVVYFMVETSASYEQINAALKASYDSFVASGKIEISVAHRQMIEQSKTSALVVGGNADDAVGIVGGVDGLLNYLTAEGDFSATSPGAPIAYTLRYLKDNKVANIVLNSEYTIRNCEEVGQPIDVPVPPIADLCPVEVDNTGQDFSGQGPKVDGKISLFLENSNRELWIKYDFNLTQTDNSTKAKAEDSVLLLVAPLNKQFVEPYVQDANVTIYPYIDDDYTPDFPSFNGNGWDFVEKIEIQGDTGQDDLPCIGYQPTGSRSYIRVWLKPFQVRVKQI